jgi:hypothetical protein
MNTLIRPAAKTNDCWMFVGCLSVLKTECLANILDVGKMAHQMARQGKKNHRNIPIGGKANETEILLK